MSEWWTYTVSDFLLFSSRTYFRLIELYNSALWPLHLVTALLGAAIVVLVLRPTERTGRIVAGMLALLWAWVAVAFLWWRYATINWAATWFAVAFAIEAIALVWAGVVRGYLTFRLRHAIAAWTGLALLVFALLGYPLIALLQQRGLAQSEVFGMMPDPTAVGTIGMLLLAAGRWRRRLTVIPLLWCLVSGAMLWALSREADAARLHGVVQPELVLGPGTALGAPTTRAID